MIPFALLTEPVSESDPSTLAGALLTVLLVAFFGGTAWLTERRAETKRDRCAALHPAGGRK